VECGVGGAGSERAFLTTSLVSLSVVLLDVVDVGISLRISAVPVLLLLLLPLVASACACACVVDAGVVLVSSATVHHESPCSAT
jgi:hypothetical protein